MQSKTSRLAKPSLLLAAVIAALALAICAATPAKAMAAEVMAYSLDDSGNRTNYYSTDAALTAGYSGKTIYLDCDWCFTGTMQIADSKTITIDMNGHKITTNGKATVILLNEKANLTLKSSATKTFSYNGFNPDDGKKSVMSITSGGLVCEGGSSNTVGGIQMNNYSTLTLDNVAVAGNEGVDAGGIYTKKECTVNLKNGANVAHNHGNAGGLRFNETNCKLNITDSTIEGNYGVKYSGGIWANDDGMQILTYGNCLISKNVGALGGGVGLNYSYFTFRAETGTMKIDGNKCFGVHGGGIYVAPYTLHTNEGTLENLTITNNYAGQNGGGIDLGQRYTSVVNCTIQNNTAGLHGGGIDVDGNNCRIVNSTITNNSAYLGGGVFVDCKCDVVLSGKDIIANNTWSKDASQADDLYLYKDDAKAYVKGGVSEGSSVGIKTNSEEDRQVGKDITDWADDAYFSDLDNHYISKEGDKLYQRSGTKKYTAQVNGVGTTQYNSGETVTADGTATEKNKSFWHWDASASKGISPITDAITDSNKYTSTITYKMQRNNTNMVAVYADDIASARFVIAQPVAGKELPTSGMLVRTDSGTSGASEVANHIEITWYEVLSDGTKRVATGFACHNKKYVACVTVDQDQKEGVFFSTDITESNITINPSGSGAVDQVATSASVNEYDGSLTFETDVFKTEASAIASIQDDALTVYAGDSTDGVLQMLPTTAMVHRKNATSVALATDLTKENLKWPEGMFEGGKVITPADGSQTFDMYIPLAWTDEVSDYTAQSLKLTITVVGTDKPAAPQVVPLPGTYDKYNSSIKLGDDLTLKVTASTISSETDGSAVIKYTINGGEEQVCNKAISLVGEANASKQFDLELWTEIKSTTGDTVKSDVTKATYVLDDTLNKTIEVNCKDTGYYAEGATHWTSSFEATGDLNSSATIVAPSQEGRVFDHWEWEGAPEGVDLNQKELNIGTFSTSLDGQITAVYKPVISSLDVDLTAPAAHAALADKATAVKIGIGKDAPSTDVTSLVGGTSEGVAVNWSPSAQADKTAAHLTSYVASIPLENDSMPSDVEYALADSVSLYVGGSAVDGRAFITNIDGVTTLCIEFDNTGAYDYKSLDSLSDVELTHAQACEFAAAQAAGKTADWNLPSDVVVNFVCGESSLVSIDWGVVTAFEENNTDEQEFTLNGKVNYTSDIDNEGAPEYVEVKVKVLAAEQVAKPVASVAAGSYEKPQSVTLSCSTEGATIYYTIDGSDPVVPASGELDPSSATMEYTGDAIDVDDDMTLKVVASKAGMINSEVASNEYKIQYKRVEAPVAAPVEGVYGADQSVELHTNTEGATIYYTTDGSDPDENSQKYDGTAILVTGQMTIKAFAGKDGMTDSETVSYTYVISHEQTAKPHVDVAPGTYADTQYVTITSDTPDAVIRYTTDGSEPGEDSPIYDGNPIEVSSSMTIKAIAYDSTGELDPSDVATFAYVISPNPAPTPDPSGDGDGGSDGGSNGANGNAAGAAGSIAATGDATPFALVGFASLIACAAFAFAALKLRRNR